MTQGRKSRKSRNVLYREKGETGPWTLYAAYAKKARARRFAKRLRAQYPKHDFALFSAEVFS